jgi:hypothetical protein
MGVEHPIDRKFAIYNDKNLKKADFLVSNSVHLVHKVQYRRQTDFFFRPKITFYQ